MQQPRGDGEMDNSLTSGQATVKRDLVSAPGRPGEAVCPLNALLPSQQPCANSLSPVCTRFCQAISGLQRPPHTKLSLSDSSPVCQSDEGVEFKCIVCAVTHAVYLCLDQH